MLLGVQSLVVVLVSQPGQAADTTPLPTKVVRPGDTLWSIAGEVALELTRRGGRLGLATMCVGVGQGQAALFERA